MRGLVNRFGTQVVHDGLDLDVYRGEVLGIVGGSGTGKSVLLRSIVGLNRPAAGSIRVFGVDVLNASDAEREAVSRRWGVLFQQGALFSALTVQQNVEAPMRELAARRPGAARGAGAAQGLDGRPAAERLRQVPLRALRRHAEARRPRPRAGARPRHRLPRRADGRASTRSAPSAFDDLIRQLKESLGLTVFMVTHDLDSLHAICDRIAVLAEKKVLVTGTMAEMLKVDHPWVREYFHGPRARAALGTTS